MSSERIRPRSAPLAAVLAALFGAGLGCDDPDFDGLYRVESYTLDEAGCDGPGEPIEREFEQFRIAERSFFGLTVYPLYPCDESFVCDEDNHGTWNLVTVEDDLDQVSMTSAFNSADGSSCVLSSVDLVIDRFDIDGVVLERRVSTLVEEPYDPRRCTTERAKKARHAMTCVSVLQVVGLPVDQRRE